MTTGPGSMGWRDRLALWCLRVLTPHGVCGQNVPIYIEFTSGQSTPDAPALVLNAVLAEKAQTIVALVLNPDTIVATVSEAVDGLREWAASERDVA